MPGLGTVETLKSTDEGVAFLVTVNETVLYHAGDLNWWLWKGEDKGWLGNMTANFKREIARIAGRRIDLAFLPLDDRQGDYFYKGMDWFLRSCRVRYAFPMHFWEDGSVVRRLNCCPAERTTLPWCAVRRMRGNGNLRCRPGNRVRGAKKHGRKTQAMI